MDGFWDDAGNAAKIQKERSVIEEVCGTYKQLQTLFDDFDILYEYALSGDDDSAHECISTFEQFLNQFKETEKKVLLSGETDPNNAIVSINAGAGGTESCDWAHMLLRMITRWADSKKFKYTILDHQEGDSAGIKSATLTIEGNYAYGLLKSESGIHRLVRVSPFDSNARRHTSFASIFVSPEIDDNIEIEILDKDIRIDVYRSGGAGGQSVNTADSAVRITHMPSGIVVTSQNERSQLQNKANAFKVLRSRLYEKAMEEKRKALDSVEASKMEIGWGSQIRSYVLHPYKLAKDHRTDCESMQPDKVLDGDIDQFIDAYLRFSVAKNQQEEQA
jgi:peptide chain release factor 2